MTSCAAPIRQARRRRRIRLAEFGLQTITTPIRAHRTGRDPARLRHRARKPTASTTTSSRRSTSPWKIFEGGVRSLTGHANAAREGSSPGPVRSPIPTTGSSRHRAARERLVVAADPHSGRRHFWQATTLAAAANTVRRLVGRAVGYWYGHYFVPAPLSRARSRHPAVDPADPDRAGAHRGDCGHRLRSQAPAPCSRSAAAGAR